MGKNQGRKRRSDTSEIKNAIRFPGYITLERPLPIALKRSLHLGPGRQGDSPSSCRIKVSFAGNNPLGGSAVVPEGLFLRKELLPLLVNFPLDPQLDLTKL